MTFSRNVVGYDGVNNHNKQNMYPVTVFENARLLTSLSNFGSIMNFLYPERLNNRVFKTLF